MQDLLTSNFEMPNQEVLKDILIDFIKEVAIKEGESGSTYGFIFDGSADEEVIEKYLAKYQESIENISKSIFLFITSDNYLTEKLGIRGSISLNRIRFHHIKNYQNALSRIPMLKSLLSKISIDIEWNVDNPVITDISVNEMKLIGGLLVACEVFGLILRYELDKEYFSAVDSNNPEFHTYFHTRDDAFGVNAQNWELYLARIFTLYKSFLVYPKNNLVNLTYLPDELCECCALHGDSLIGYGNHCEIGANSESFEGVAISNARIKQGLNPEGDSVRIPLEKALEMTVD